MNLTTQQLKRILNNGRSYIPGFLLLGAAGLVMVPIEFYGLLLSRELIDKGFVLQNWSTIRHILFVVILLFILRSVIKYGTTIFSTSLQLRMNQKFQDDLFAHLLGLPLSYLLQAPTGQTMSRVLDDATRFSSVFRMIFGPAMLNPFKLIALLGLLIYFDARLCAIMVISIVFSFIVIHRVGGKLRIISKQIQKQNAVIFSFVEQIFANIELIKSKTAEQQTAVKFRRLLDELIQLSLDTVKISLIAQPVLQLLKYFALGAVFVLGSWMIAKDLLTIGTLTLFLGSTYLFFNTINSLGNTYGSIRENLARLELILGIMDSPPEQSAKSDTHPMPATINSVEFHNISFGYTASAPVLKDVSFTIFQGETLGITGQSGSGKTTLIRLLARFYEPNKGDIRINGQPIRQFDLFALRASLGIVFQENLILNDTIKNNITYGHKNISWEQTVRAARIARASDFIESLPNRYDTVVGEVGRSLSGGERQRISIARAMIADPEILILDEGTAFLEIDQERRILQKIKEARRGKITVIISHRLSAMTAAERILILDQGRLVETELQSLTGSDA